MKWTEWSICRSPRSWPCVWSAGSEHDGGFIDNVAGTNANAGIIDGVRSFPSWSTAGTTNGVPNNGGIGQGSISNAAYVKNDYNTVETKGGRAALKLDLGQLDRHSHRHGSESHLGGLFRL